MRIEAAAGAVSKDPRLRVSGERSATTASYFRTSARMSLFPIACIVAHGGAQSLPRRGSPVHVQQRRRAGSALRRRRAQKLDLRRIRRRRPSCRGYLHAHRDRKAQRYRSPGLARGCPRALARSSGQADRRSQIYCPGTGARRALPLRLPDRATGSPGGCPTPWSSPDAYPIIRPLTLENKIGFALRHVDGS